MSRAMTMTIESTAAKIGRSMKKREKRTGASWGPVVAAGVDRVAPVRLASASIGPEVAVTFMPGRTRCTPLTTVSARPA